MQFEEMGNMSGKTMMLLPGTCCNWQTNFSNVISRLADKYHLICVNYGDMQAFADKLRAQGYEKVELIHTDSGMFMSRSERKILGLSGSTLLVGRK